MNISLIVAMTMNRVIGFKRSIPWMLSSDLSWFKYNTLNKPVIMGHTTYKTIGKPLNQRLNIVFSHTYVKNNDMNVIWVNSIREALVIVKNVKEIMIIGGGEIYKLFLPIANRLYLTHVDAKINGDTYFPVYNRNWWSSRFIEHHKADKKNSHDYYFEILER